MHVTSAGTGEERDFASSPAELAAPRTAGVRFRLPEVRTRGCSLERIIFHLHYIRAKRRFMLRKNYEIFTQQKPTTSNHSLNRE